MNESVIIGRAERFLDDIKKKEINIENIQDCQIFLELHSYFKSNMEVLLEMRDVMEIKGYTAPYRSIMKYGRGTSTEMKSDDMYDISRHTQYFRMNAAAKKNILDRVKSALASHRIALGHLEEFATLECESCNKKYKGHEISLLENFKCECGKENLRLQINIQGVSRLQIIPLLPLSGDYMVKLSELGPLSREAFRKLVRILKQEKRGIVKTLSLVVKVMEDGRWVRKREIIDAHNQPNYEKEIRNKYGPDARIEFMQFHRKKPSIINDKHVQTALSLGYVKHMENQIMAVLPELLENYLEDASKVDIYLESLKSAEKKAKKFGEVEDEDILKEKYLKDELQSQGFMDREGVLDIKVHEDLEYRKKIEKCLFMEIPRIIILWDLLKYYLTTSYDRRIKHSGPFPFLRPELDLNQIKAFEDFKVVAVEVMKYYLHQKIEFVPNMKNVLSHKFMVEKKMKGLHLQMSPALGAAILSSEGQLTVEKTSELFQVDPKDVKIEKNNLKTLQKPKTPKAQKFMEMMKR